jgi:hypothetical protein
MKSFQMPFVDNLEQGIPLFFRCVFGEGLYDKSIWQVKP